MIMRTTIDIDDPVLRELKKLQAATGKSLGQLASELLAQALAGRPRQQPRVAFRWTSRAMGALVDVTDKEALYRLMDDES